MTARRKRKVAKPARGQRKSAAVENLPHEILAEVFKFVLVIERSQQSRVDLRKYPDQDFYEAKLRPPVALSHVCRTWRIVSLDTAVLWEEIELDIQRTSRDEKCAQMWIDRSKGRPLHFIVDTTLPTNTGPHNVLDYDGPQPAFVDPLHRQIYVECAAFGCRRDAISYIDRFEGFCSFLERHFQRARKVEFFNTSSGMEQLLLSHIVPILESRQCTHLQQLNCPHRFTDAVLASRVAPLHELYMDFLPSPSLYSSLNDLRSLKLEFLEFPPYETFKSIVTAPSRLLELSLRWDESGQFVLPGPEPNEDSSVLRWSPLTIVLPFLEHLDLQDDFAGVDGMGVHLPLLSFLRTPALTVLKFRMFQYLPPDTWARPFVARIEYPADLSGSSLPVRPRHDFLLAQLEHLEITECPGLSISEAASFLSCLSSLRSLAFSFMAKNRDMYNYLLMTHQPSDAREAILYTSPGSSQGQIRYPLPFTLPYDKEQPFLPALRRLIVWNLTGAQLKRLVKFRIDHGVPVQALYFNESTRTSRQWLSDHVSRVGQFKTSYGDQIPDWI